MADTAAVATPALANPNADECVGGIKTHLVFLLASEPETNVELSELRGEWERAQTVHLTAVERVKEKLEAVRAETKAAESEMDTAVKASSVGGSRVVADAELVHLLDVELSELHVEWERAQTVHLAAMERVNARRKAMRAEIKAVETKLDAAVNAPVSGGRDPTLWLPDELLLMVFEMLSFVTLWSGATERVSQRWARLMESASIVRRKRGNERWAAHEAGMIKPHRLEGHTSAVYALVVGLDGRVYSGSSDNTIMVWSGESSVHLQTLKGHTNWVNALAVGLDGNIYSGSADSTVMVWSGTTGAHTRTLNGHTAGVFALAVGLEGKIYSGSGDKTIRVWSADDGTHLQTLERRHRGPVRALAVSKDGAVYSGSADETIRVWSGKDGAHLRTLSGHEGWVVSLAVAPDGRVYSGSLDKTIREWSPDGGTHLQTLAGHTSAVWVLAVGLDGSLFSGSDDGTVRMWNGETGALLHTLRGGTRQTWALALASNMALYSGGYGRNQVCLEMR
jgi:hypothetical protein